ncbi:MAG: HipA domain-containing protein [Eggerthella lenta]
MAVARCIARLREAGTCVERYDRRQLETEESQSFQGFIGRPASVQYRPKRTASSSPPPPQRSARSSDAILALSRIWKRLRGSCFNYLVGNCDNHLKNLSILYRAPGRASGLRLRTTSFRQLGSNGSRDRWG